MKQTITLVAAALMCVIGCSDSSIPPSSPYTGKPRKEFKDMTKEEKIDFINHTPGSEDAHKRSIARINAGQE